MFKLFLKPSAFRFKRFVRKQWAAFASMYREFTIGTVRATVCEKEMLKEGKTFAVVAAMLMPTFAFALDDIPDEPDSALQAAVATLRLEEVEVVANANQTAFQYGLGAVNQITAAEIQSLPVNSIADLLQYLPAFDLRERGASGIQADLSIRGGTPDQVKVLLNGTDLTDSQTGHYTMDLPLDLSLIDHIEVLNGTQYGLGSFSGAINIITSPNPSQGGGLNSAFCIMNCELTSGEYGLFNPSLAGSYTKDNFSLLSSISYNQSTGYAENTDYRIANAYLKMNVELGKLKVELPFGSLDAQAHSTFNSQHSIFSAELGAQYKDAGANSFYSLAYPNQFDATRTILSSLQWKKQWSLPSLGGAGGGSLFSLSTNANYRGHYDRFELFREGLQTDGTPAPDWYEPNLHWTHTTDLRIEGMLKTLRYGEAHISLDLRDEYLNSSNLGVRNRINLQYTGEYIYHHKKLTASIGASGIFNTQFGSDWAIGATLNYMPVKGLALSLNANRAVRIPTWTDLYYQSATHISNPNLRPEKATQVEASVGYKIPLSNSHGQLSTFNFQLSAFYRWGRDIIDWVKATDETAEWQSLNWTAVDGTGTEISASIGNLEYLTKAEIAYSYCYINKSAGEMISKYAMDYLRHKVSLRIIHKIYKGFGASWCLRFQDRAGAYTNREGETVNYTPVWLLDGSLYYENDIRHRTQDKGHSFRISLDCQNMTNTQYYDFGGILQPQHWVSCSVRCRL